MRIKNLKIQRICQNKWKKKHPEKQKEYQKRYAEKNKLKIIAHNSSNYSIKIKDICEICNAKSNLEKHHWDYNKPLLVNTLCKPCHIVQHYKKKDNYINFGGNNFE